jgi:hypothetical protein
VWHDLTAGSACSQARRADRVALQHARSAHVGRARPLTPRPRADRRLLGFLGARLHSSTPDPDRPTPARADPEPEPNQVQPLEVNAHEVPPDGQIELHFCSEAR